MEAEKDEREDKRVQLKSAMNVMKTECTELNKKEENNRKMWKK